MCDRHCIHPLSSLAGKLWAFLPRCALVVFLVGAMVFDAAGVPVPDAHLTFDESLPNLENDNGAYVPARRGMGFAAIRGRDRTFDVRRMITTRQGTLSIWVKPEWPEGDRHSHTLLSLQWADSKDGYLALSQGFFEKRGGRPLYFILANHSLNCAAPETLLSGVWTMVTLVWETGPTGYCKIFLNDSLVTEKRKPFSSDAKARGMLVIGSDRGAGNRRNRTADAVLDDLRIWNVPLGDNDIDALYRSETAEGERQAARRALSAALTSETETVHLQRDEQGVAFESRVLLDPDIGWAMNDRNIDEIVSRLVAGGFNTYVVAIWQGRGAYYPSNIAPLDPRLRGRVTFAHDPLQHLLDKAHAHGIEVHAWFNVVQRRSDFLPEFKLDQEGSHAFDVHNPAFRDFFVDIVEDVVKRYPIDGVNLDHVRSIDICTTEFCNADYSRRYGRALTTDVLLSRLPGKRVDTLEAWNYAAVTDIVARVAARSRARRPNVVISVDSHPLAPAFLRQGQDSIKWANLGYVDVIFNMDYRKLPDLEAMKTMRLALSDPGKLVLLAGTYEVYGDKSLRDPQLLESYVRLTRTHAAGTGIAFYSNKALSREQLVHLKSSIFAEPARPTWAHNSGTSSDPHPDRQ